MRIRLLTALCGVAVVVPACIDFKAAQDGFCANRPGTCPSELGSDGGTGGGADGGGADGGGGEADGGSDAGSTDAGLADGGVDAGSATADPTGAWLRSVGSPFTTFHAYGGIAGTGEGDVTLAGSFKGFSDFGAGDQQADLPPGVQAVVARYDERGQLKWTRTFGTTGDDYGIAAGGDRAGNSYVILNVNGGAVLAMDGGVQPGGGSAVVKLLPDGGFTPLMRMTGGTNAGGYYHFLQRATVAANGKVLAAGRFMGSGPAPTPACALNFGAYAYGAHLAYAIHPDGGCAFTAVMCDGTGDVADVAIDDVTGDMLVLIDNRHTDCSVGSAYSRSGVPANTLWLVHFNADGTFANANPLFIPDGTPARIASHNGVGWLATGFSGALTMGDAGYASTGGTDLVLVKLQTVAGGAVPKSERVFGNGGDLTVRSLAFGPAGTLWLAGDFTQDLALGGTALDAGPGPSPTPFFAELSSPDLTVLRAQALSATGRATVSDVSFTSDGGVLLGGDFTNTVDFGTDAGAVTAQTSTGSQSPQPPSLFFGRPALVR
jgi:hypothetical protein